MVIFKSKQKKFEGSLKIKLCGERLYPTEDIQNIMLIALQCKDHGVKDIILSSVVATDRVNADVIIHFNESLKNLCRANGFCFVNKDNISEGNLYKDRLHLLEAGKRILANNFINGINNYY